MSSNGSVIQSIREDKVYWTLLMGKVAAGLFLAFNLYMLKHELNAAGCSKAVKTSLEVVSMQQ